MTKKTPTIISPIAVKDELVKRILLSINDNINTIFGRKVGSSPYVTADDLVKYRLVVKNGESYMARNVNASITGGAVFSTISTQPDSQVTIPGAGVVAKTGANTYQTREILGTANEVTLTNGDGTAGDPTVSLPSSLVFTGKTVTNGAFNNPEITTNITAVFTGGIDTEYVDFDMSPTATPQEGRMMWDADEGVPATGLAGGTVRLQHGLELLKRVRNASGVAMTDGQLVYIDGATGVRPKVFLSSAASATPEKWCVCGMVTEPIPADQQGYICVIGSVADVDTSAYVEGTALYLSPTVDGGFTDTPPDAPDAIVPIGVVLRQHATEGVILFFPQQAKRFIDLADVNGTPLTTDGQIAEWDTTNQYFDFTKNINDYARFDTAATFPSLKVGTETDFTEIEADGTIISKGEATCWRDELESLIKAASNNPASRLAYDFVEGTLDYKTNATTADYATMNIQINHDWKAGSSVEPHIHWFQSQDNIPNWLLEYRWQINCEAKTTAWTRVPWAANACEYVSGEIIQITSFGLIAPPVGYSTSDILQLRFIRDTNNASGLFAGADPYTVDAKGLSADVHIEVDMFGSRQRYIK